MRLAELQTSKSEWHARRARVILQSRAAKKKLSEDVYLHLKKVFNSHANADYRLRAMWTLHVTNGFESQDLLTALGSKDEYTRAWAIQLLCEDKAPPAAALKEFERMATDDKSPVVRLYLASAMRRMEKGVAWRVGKALIVHGEDASDHNLPKMIWFAMEPLVAEDPEQGLALATESRLPLIAEYTARRVVDADATDKLIAVLQQKPRTMESMLQGMRDALEGRNDLTAPAGWATLYAELQKSKGRDGVLAAEIAQLFGDTQAALQSLATLKDKSKDAEARKKALNSLAMQQRRELVKELPSLLEDPAVRLDAIRAIAGYDDGDLGSLLLKKYPRLSAGEKREAVLTLSARPRYGRMLNQALKDGSIPKTDVPVYVARQLRRVVGSGFVETWGPIDELPASENAAYNKYQRLLTGDALRKADPAKGKILFQQTCGSCHKMFGEGGNIGPDLTGSNRTNVNYILSNVLNPSEEIQDDYKMVVVTTRDGRTYSGNIVGENSRQLTLRVVGQDAVIINKSDIQSQEATDVSMMPPGLFDMLRDEQVLDLVSYLRSSEPLASGK
jgi:putative heme-binding domain-containing protein